MTVSFCWILLVAAISCAELPVFNNTEELPGGNESSTFYFDELLSVNCSPGYAYNDSTNSLHGFNTFCDEQGEWFVPDPGCQGKVTSLIIIS